MHWLLKFIYNNSASQWLRGSPSLHYTQKDAASRHSWSSSFLIFTWLNHFSQYMNSDERWNLHVRIRVIYYSVENQMMTDLAAFNGGGRSIQILYWAKRSNTTVEKLVFSTLSTIISKCSSTVCQISAVAQCNKVHLLKCLISAILRYFLHLCSGTFTYLSAYSSTE